MLEKNMGRERERRGWRAGVRGDAWGSEGGFGAGRREVWSRIEVGSVWSNDGVRRENWRFCAQLREMGRNFVERGEVTNGKGGAEGAE